MHETLKEVTRKIEVKKAGQRGKGLGKVAWRKTLKVTFLSARKEQERVFHKRSALRESLLSMWRVDKHQALRTCEDRQIEVDLLKALYVSLDKLHNQWPS